MRLKKKKKKNLRRGCFEATVLNLVAEHCITQQMAAKCCVKKEETNQRSFHPYIYSNIMSCYSFR